MNSKALLLRRGLSAILLGMLLLIGGCSSSSDSSTTTTTSSTLSGTAATGAPIVGVLYVKDASGTEINVVIDASGSFSIDVSGLTAPFLLRAVPDDTALPAQFSFAAAAGTVNISQLTSLALQTALGSSGLNALYSGWDGTQVGSAGILVAQAIVTANFASQLAGQGLTATTYSFFSTAFSADGTGIDAVLDSLTVVIDLDAGTVTVSDTSGTLTFDLSIDTSGFMGGSSGSGGSGGSGGTSGTYGSLTFTDVGATLVPSGSDPFTFTPDTLTREIDGPTWVMGSGANHITLFVPRAMGTDTVTTVNVASGASTSVRAWNLTNATTGVTGVVVSLSGNLLSFTFTDVQVPEFVTGSSTLVMNGTLTMDMSPSTNTTPADLGGAAVTSTNVAALGGTTFAPTKVTRETTVDTFFGGTSVVIEWLFSPQAGELHTLTFNETTGSSISSLNSTTLTYSRILNGGLDPAPANLIKTGAAGYTLSADSVVFVAQALSTAEVINGQIVFSAITLDGTLTIPATDGTIE